MESKTFNSLEIDAIGEILNISLGASATAVSTMLSKRVDITIPTVIVSNKEDFEFSYMEPAVGVEITYVSGLSGKNIMLLKRHDVKVIVEILMGIEIADEEFELNEINLSAVCEVMNQMMGASSTALSELLGEVVNISTPTSYEINTVNEFKEKYLIDDQEMVVVKFLLKIEDAIESEFLNIMTIDLARRLLSCVGLGENQENNIIDESVSDTSLEEKEINNLSNYSVENESLSSFSESEHSNKTLSQEEIEKLLNSNNLNQENNSKTIADSNDFKVDEAIDEAKVIKDNNAASNNPTAVSNQEQRIINVIPQKSDYNPECASEERPENLNLIMDVPLEISVEIGRTTKYVKEILEYNQGSLIVLDKLAGDQVDVFVNGQCIAKGDVVVVDDCFGVRITEVLKKI